MDNLPEDLWTTITDPEELLRNPLADQVLFILKTEFDNFNSQLVAFALSGNLIISMPGHQ